MTCADLDLKVDLQPSAVPPDQYSVEVINSPCGRSPALTLSLPAELNSHVRRLRDRQTDRDTTKALGVGLFVSLFPPRIRSIWERMLGSHQILRVRLDIRVPELMNLPWELLHDGRNYLALSDSTPVIRFLAEHESSKDLAVEGALNFLLVTSTPTDLSALPGVGLESRAILDQLQGSVREITLRPPEQIEHASLSALRSKLSDAHVVHYMGHGEFSSNRGYLWLENADGSGQPQEAEIVGNHMRDGAVRVLVLNACDTAIASTATSLIGVAQAAHAAGVPVVVGMQQTILDSAAPKFAQGFYRALLDRKPIESCMVAGRLAMQESLGPDSAEWAIPVMFSNAPAGELCWLQKTKESMNESIRMKKNQGPVILGGVGRDVITIYNKQTTD